MTAFKILNYISYNLYYRIIIGSERRKKTSIVMKCKKIFKCDDNWRKGSWK